MRKGVLRTWVEISRSALLHNVRAYRKILPDGIGIMAVIKSNAYGHGMVETAALLEKKVDFFAVVFIEEALELRKRGIRKPILVFSTVTFDGKKLERAIRENIAFTVYDDESYRRISASARRIRKRAVVHINTDTGMSRLGFSAGEHEKAITRVCGNSYLDIQGLYSHLSSADTDIPFTKQQCRRFTEAVHAAEDAYCDIPHTHILNTPGAMLGINVGSLARIGLGLFGLPPSDLSVRHAKKITSLFSLKPAMSWKTRIIQLRHVGKGTDVGYGRTYRTRKETDLATVPVGFADGYSRSLSNAGEILIRGKRCPIRGRICMSNIMIDVSGVRGVKPGDEAVLIGTSGGETITVEEIARKRDTNLSEIATTIPETIPRVYR